jgi:nitrite reductase (NO-forming)
MPPPGRQSLRGKADHTARRILPLVVVAVLAAVLAACASPAGPTWTFAPAASPSCGSGAEPTAHSSAGAQVSASGKIEVEAFDLGFNPATLTVPSAGMYEVSFHNSGASPHDITFADGTKIPAEPGATAAGTVTIPEAGLTFICSIPGHEQAGMKGAVTVEGSAPAPSGNSHGGPLPTGSIAADPNAPAYKPYDPTAPALLPGKTHDIELVMTEQQMTVAPGFSQAVWTFGGTVPGPVIRVKVGDTVRVHLKNPIENKMSHSIDFHASQVAPNDEMRSIAPGEELVYEWTADYAGVWMYHCGTAPMLHHIANGMYGMVIVEPREGLPKVDKEFAIVQSEWYLGPQGKESDLDKAMAAAPAPDFVLFNGVANQYEDHPLKVGTGERVRIFVLNAGPSVDSSFHIVGTIFDTVRKEGVALSRGNVGNWGSQAIDLSPAQGGFVELVPAEDGMYPIVTHAFNFVGRGAVGMLQAGDGDPAN